MLTKSLFGLAATALLTTTLLAACSSKGSAAAPVAEADFALQAAHAICDSIKPCCAQTGYTYDQAACLTAQEASIKKELEKPANTTYDPGAAGRCLQMVRDAVAACADSDSRDDAADDACNAIYVGTKQNGETCNKSAECAPSTEGRVRCNKYSTTSGTADPDAGAKTPTVESGSQCQLVKRNAAKGDACGSGPAKSGVKPPSIVSDCVDGSKTSTMYCDENNTCQPKIATGQACSLSSYGACEGGGSCNDGKCVAPGAEGATCQYGEGCGADLYCDVSASSKTGDGKCAKQKKAGEACDKNAAYGACATGTCSEGKCSAGSYARASACKGTPEKASDSSGSSGGTVEADAGSGKTAADGG